MNCSSKSSGKSQLILDRDNVKGGPHYLRENWVGVSHLRQCGMPRAPEGLAGKNVHMEPIQEKRHPMDNHTTLCVPTRTHGVCYPQVEYECLLSSQWF